MTRLFSPWFKGANFRKLWIALAVAQKNAGLPITAQQIAQMQSQEDAIDFDRIQHHEKIFRHDVMAHIYAFGDVCPEAKPILHWGATSSYVTDNTDLIQLKKALELLFQKMLHVLQTLGVLAAKHAQDPCLGYTHFQPAQPTTIGKRICLWLQDFLLDAKQWNRLVREMPFLGVKGATGTQSSFLALLDGDHEKVLEMERQIARAFGFSHVVPIAGQTYPRKIDIEVLHSIASFAASAHKFGTDLRLLSHEGEIGEASGKEQVGSSAMPYKRNPIYSERICGLARFAISLAQNPIYTAATQWLERSLDDSSNRRLSIPEAFLSADAILNTMIHILSALQIDKEASLAQVVKHLPTLCMENILMESVKRGADRQQIHETLRQMARDGRDSSFEEMIVALEKNKNIGLSKQEIERIANPKTLTGRASHQVSDFLQTEVTPFLQQHPPQNLSIPHVGV
jgi:adenylosuccinate lyase